MPDSIIVDIYCRSATSSQESSARLDEQEQTCREYCAAKGLTVGTVYRDVFSGNQLKGRPMFPRM
jgi:DNA invertase Pin-like site-specific DNA recombinase